MLPIWIKDRITVTWYAKGRWEPIALTEQNGIYEGKTADGDRILLHIKREKAANGRQNVFQVKVRIVSDSAGVISGMRLHMPLDPSLACTWKPHLAPGEDMTIGDKAFRSPAIILEDEHRRVALIPDLSSMEAGRPVPHIMDYVQREHELYYGVSAYEETGHVYYRLNPKPVPMEELCIQFFLVEWLKEEGEEKRDFRQVEHFLWERFAKTNMALSESPEDIVHSLQVYPYYAYDWAFNRWKDVCWQQFSIGDREVGGVVFIVTAKQKPGHGQMDIWREPKSLWNQAWFCSLRTAYGYWQGGHRFNRPNWTEKAEKALEFALSAPQTNGLFPGYYQAGDDNKWECGRWYMSAPRRPGGHEEYVHLLDASWTCYWLLKWYRDIRKDPRILSYVVRYAERLVSLQRTDGGFPAWVRPDTLECSPYLAESPEASMHAMLLCLLQEVDSAFYYASEAEKAAAYVLDHIVSEGKWEDFETYWSCSREWEGKQYGVKDPRSGLYNQCNFGIYWTAEALAALYKLTGSGRWLDAGERVLAEASLYQQIWEPPYIPVPTLGGFGVMNSDDEWNDARQSLFALTYYEYYRCTGNESYLARSMWAIKASFYMMYCPENPVVKKIYESVHTHFGERDYGFHMENFNHHDGTQVAGLGEFTIFDWGCGAASSSLAELSSKVSSVKPTPK
jgi:hypothetical protein